MRWRLIPIFFVCMIVYAIVGGIIFHFVETKHEKNTEPVLREKVQDFLDAHPCANLTRLLKLKLLLKKAEAAGLHLNRQTRSIVNLTNWDIQNSIFLAAQIIGAVGYGNVTPQTVGGKLFTIFFTIIGIPLFVVFAFGVGKPIARLVRYLERRMCGAWVLHSRALESQPVPQNKAEKRAIKKVLKLRKFWVYFLRVFLLFVVGSIFFVVIPAAIFNAIEPWSYGESIYFCYVTVLSVGFGDYVPGEATEKSYRNWYRLATSLYVYIGVAYFVVVFFPIQEVLNFRKAINTPLTFNRDENGDAQSNHGGQDKRDWFRVGWRHSDPDLHKRPTVTPAQPARPHTGSYPGPYVGRGIYGSWNSAPPGAGYGGALSGGIYGAQGGYTKSGDGLSVPQAGANRVAQGKVTSVAVNAS